MNHDFNERYGRILADMLRRRGWKPAALARQVGVDRRTVERWIHGKATPHLEVAFHVEKTLGFPAELSSKWMVER